MMRFSLVFISLLAVCFANGIKPEGYYAVKCSLSIKCTVSGPHAQEPTDYTAWCHYKPTLEQNGWDELRMKTHPDAKPRTAAYALGICEGTVSGQRTRNHRHNLHTFMLDHYMNHATAWPRAIHDWIQDNEEYVRRRATARADTDDFWFGVQLMLDQIDGLARGLNDGFSGADIWSVHDVFMHLASGELLDLANFLKPQGFTPFDWENATDEEKEYWHTISNRCSGLMRLSPDHRDIWLGQVAWFTYGSMTRVLKSIEFGWAGQRGQLAERVTFSSYPGFIMSFDDFYANSEGVAAFETTNSVFAKELYYRAIPQSVFTFMRAPLATRMADNALDWARIFARENSGTYNNQWQIANYNLLPTTPGGRLAPGTAVVLEQVPGLIEYRDVTEYLEQHGYIPSFNANFLPTMRRVSGQDDAAVATPSLGWETAPRYHVFRGQIEDENKCRTYEEYQTLLRYNDNTNPAQAGSPGFGIASRYDQRPENPIAFGGLDAKTVSRAQMTATGAPLIDAVAGPTRGAGEQYEAWTFTPHKNGDELDSVLNPPHRGLPENVPWTFDWVRGFGMRM